MAQQMIFCPSVLHNVHIESWFRVKLLRARIPKLIRTQETDHFT